MAWHGTTQKSARHGCTARTAILEVHGVLLKCRADCTACARKMSKGSTSLILHDNNMITVPKCTIQFILRSRLTTRAISYFNIDRFLPAAILDDAQPVLG